MRLGESLFVALVAASTLGCLKPLVLDGRAEGVIVAPLSAAAGDDADREVAAAGQELQSYFFKMTGVRVPLVSRPSPHATSIRIGVFGCPPVRGWSGSRPPADGYAIETRGDTLWVVGG